MDYEPFEFTVDDVLTLHRSWITKLYIEDKKSVADIVQELYSRRLFVSVHQLRQCLISWNLPRSLSRSSENSLSTPLAPTHRSSATSTKPHIHCSSSDPNATFTSQVDISNEDLYANRPLPPLPTNSPSQQLSSDKSREYHLHTRFPSLASRMKLTSYDSSISGGRPALSIESELSALNISQDLPLREAHDPNQDSHQRHGLGPYNRGRRVYYRAEEKGVGGVSRERKGARMVRRDRTGEDGEKKRRKKGDDFED